jgi:hypothetical protein
MTQPFAQLEATADNIAKIKCNTGRTGADVSEINDLT